MLRNGRAKQKTRYGAPSDAAVCEKGSGLCRSTPPRPPEWRCFQGPARDAIIHEGIRGAINDTARVVDIRYCSPSCLPLVQVSEKCIMCQCKHCVSGSAVSRCTFHSVQTARHNIIELLDRCSVVTVHNRIDDCFNG